MGKRIRILPRSNVHSLKKEVTVHEVIEILTGEGQNSGT